MNNKVLILTYDIGTSGNKCTIFNAGGGEVAQVNVPYETIYPKPGWAEQRPADYWHSVIKGTKALLDNNKFDAADIAIIGLSGQMMGCLPVSSDGEPLYNNIIHSDTRSENECKQILNILTENEIFNITGNRVDTHFSVPKMLWIKNHYPDIYEQTAFFLHSKDYIAYKLTGALGFTDFSDACYSGLDITDKKWSESYLTAIGLDSGKLPQILRSFDVVGHLTGEVASLLGLVSGTPVVMGGADAACATRGAGVSNTKTAYNYIGSSSWIGILNDSPVMDPGMRIQNFYDLGGEQCNACGTVQSAGAACDWAIESIGKFEVEKSKETEQNLFAMIEKTAAESPIGSNGVFFLPYLMGERTPMFDSNARGGFIGISLYHTRSDLLRAVYEGVAFALRNVLDVYDENNLMTDQLILIGGGAKSSFWNEILCNVYGKKTIVHKFPGGATSLGSAMAAGVGAGIFQDFNSACEMTVSFGKEYIPVRETMEQYDKHYKVYKMMYPCLKPIYDELVML